MSESQELERLRAAFQATAQEGAGEEAIDAEKVWEAVNGRLSPQQLKEIVEQMSRSPEIAEAWRIAREMAAAARHEEADDVVVPITHHRRWLAPVRARWLAAAAVVIVGIAVGVLMPHGQPGPRWRGDSQATIEAESVEVAPSGEIHLRWTALPDGTVYEIVVTDAQLNVLDQARNLTVAEHTVPSSALADLSAGDVVLWRVDAVTSSGKQISSPTFVIRRDQTPSSE